MAQGAFKAAVHTGAVMRTGPNNNNNVVVYNLCWSRWKYIIYEYTLLAYGYLNKLNKLERPRD
jgi:hypothetical protein